MAFTDPFSLDCQSRERITSSAGACNLCSMLHSYKHPLLARAPTLRQVTAQPMAYDHGRTEGTVKAEEIGRTGPGQRGSSEHVHTHISVQAALGV